MSDTLVLDTLGFPLLGVEPRRCVVVRELP
jgi:hypothetical protein